MDAELQRADNPLLRAGVRALLTSALVVALYYWWPDMDESFTRIWMTIAIETVLLIGLTYWQFRSILSSEAPRLRVLQMVALILPFFVTTYALVYYLLAQDNAAMFNQPLTKTGALYFSMTVFSTVGFGDIVATTDTSRIVVMFQMLMNVVFVGVVFRSIQPLLTAFKEAKDRRDAAESAK